MLTRTLIRAELSDSTLCSAAGLTAINHVPVLALCRQLLAAGINPDPPIHVYRGDTLCLVVRSIGEAAQVAVRDDNRGVPRFVAYRPGPNKLPRIACGGASRIAQNSAGAS